MTKYIPEIFDEVNADPTALEKYKSNAAIRMIFEYAFLPEKKFDLPDGEPPFKPEAAPIGLTPTSLHYEVKRLYVFTPARQLSKVRKEQLFIQLLESVHPSEAKVVLAVKDQKLTELYKNITPKLAAEYGFIPQQKEDTVGDESPKKS